MKINRQSEASVCIRNCLHLTAQAQNSATTAPPYQEETTNPSALIKVVKQCEAQPHCSPFLACFSTHQLTVGVRTRPKLVAPSFLLMVT